MLLCGATGLVGREVLRMALDDPAVSRVVAPTRRPLPTHPKLVNPVVDFEQLPTDADWWQADAAICTLGTTLRDAGSPEAFRRVDFDYVLAFAQLARAGGARAFALTSSLGADAASRYFYLRTKGEVEQAVRALGYPSLTVVRPSLIGRERQRRRLLEHVGMRLLQALAPCVPRRYRIVPAEKIAYTLLRSAFDMASGCAVISSEQLQSFGRIKGDADGTRRP
jgi:uncharacterized protein YbjT (DUF2867 family)